VTGRTIGWEGFHNARDLGGLPAGAGRAARRGALIRSGDLRFVTAAGWRAAAAAGVRTVIDLRNDDEIRPSTDPGPTARAGSAQFAPAGSGPAVPDDLDWAQVALDGVADTEFWRDLNRRRLNGTPLYFRPFLERKPDRCAAAIRAVARARPGGVIFHCGGGRDRTGLLALLILALAGVPAEIIAADYELSTGPRRALSAAMGTVDEGPIIAQVLAEHGTTSQEAIITLLAEFDAEAYLRAAGVAGDDLTALRARLLT
jgi:hypothetical protein